MLRLPLIALLIICCVGGVAAQTEKRRARGDATAAQLIGYERQSWEAVRQKDYAKFASFLAPDFYDIFPNGEAVGRQKIVEYIRAVDLRDYTLTDFHVVKLNPRAAIVVYTVVAHGTENKITSRDIAQGELSAIHAAVTSGWAMRGGRWLNVFYREHDIK